MYIYGSYRKIKTGVPLFLDHSVHCTDDQHEPVCVTAVGLELRRTYIAGTVHYGVFCLRPLIVRGTKFGPFRGRVVNLSEIKTSADNSFMWEVGNLPELSSRPS